MTETDLALVGLCIIEISTFHQTQPFVIGKMGERTIVPSGIRRLLATSGSISSVSKTSFPSPTPLSPREEAAARPDHPMYASFAPFALDPETRGDICRIIPWGRYCQ